MSEGNIEKRNKLEDGEAYSQAETALCIWEHFLDMLPRGKRTNKAFQWITGGEGAYAGRSNSIRLAHLVDHAYNVANGDDCRLDGYAFDWELVPFMIDAWIERYDHPSDVDIEGAEKMAILLLATFGDRGVNK